MAEIEALTKEDRFLLERGVAGTPQGEKAIRIIDSQQEMIERLTEEVVRQVSITALLEKKTGIRITYDEIRKAGLLAPLPQVGGRREGR